MTQPEAFVYLWRDSNNSKFYLGYHKGSTDDNYAHSSTVMESFKMNSIPEGYTRRILAVGSNEDMIELEQKLLTNRKERGRWDKYYNIKLGVYPYLWDDPEFCKMQSDKMNVLWDDPEYCRKHSDRMSAQMKKQWDDPEFCKMQSDMTKARLKKQWNDPEYRKNQSDKMKSQWVDPDFRKMQAKKMSAQMKKQWDDPEYCRKHSDRMKKQWDDPEYRKRVSGQWNDPEYCRKQRATCSVCGHESTKSSITRWHNDKCKHKSL